MRCPGIAFALLTVTALPAFAAKPVTLEQLRETFASAQSEHRSDDAQAHQLQDVKLTARLTGSALQQLIATSPGPKTMQALRAIADESAFLDPPASSVLDRPAPSAAEQTAIFNQTLHYAVHVLPTLPNFVATRNTEHYVDSMRGLELESAQRGGLFWIGSHSTPIAFRDGRETDDPTMLAASANSGKRNSAGGKNSGADPLGGLSSWGEFGPILKVVLGDSLKGKLSWARWEQEDGKPLAVFQFAIDRSVSHYGVSYCCEVSIENTSAGLSKTKRPVLLRQIGYHGNLTVDPETGTILRVSMEAELRREDPIARASMMVEYSLVKIGESVSVCPTHSVSVTVSTAQFESHGELDSVQRLLLNDVQFTGYHRFGSESTLIADAPPEAGPKSQPENQPAATPQDTAGQSQSAQASMAASAQPESTAPQTAPPANLSAAATPPAPSAAAASPADADADREILIRAADLDPLLAASDAKPAATGDGNGDAGIFTLKTSTRSVEVDMVANDKRGKPVADLKREEVNLLDNGRPQQLREFFHATPAENPTPASTNSSAAPAPAAQDSFTNATPAAGQSTEASDLLILLMDESHLAFLDLNRAREETLRFLAKSRPSSRIALYSISERGFRVTQDVTQDHALVAAKLKAWTPQIQGVSQAQAAPPQQRVSGQVASSGDILDMSDLQGNSTGTPVAVQAGNMPLAYALQSMVVLARHFSSTPGRKSIAWISGDMALAGWNGMKSNPQVEAAIQDARQALNDARIALYAVDASSPDLGAGGFDATVANPNGDTPAISNGPTGPRPLPSSAPVQSAGVGIQGPARELAEATGGRAISKASDLAATLDGIDRESSSYYELAFDPDTAADGKYHTLQVNAPARKNVVLRYRTGYLYSEESKSAKDRFQQAVWSPQDLPGITLTAEPIAAKDSSTGSAMIKLRIAFPGLALEQKDDRWKDQLYIFIAQRDDATQKAEVSGDTLRLSLRQASYDSGFPAGIPYQREVEVKSKLGSVRVIVVDGNSGKMGSVTLPASVLHP